MAESWFSSILTSIIVLTTLFFIFVAIRQRLFAFLFDWFIRVFFFRQMDKIKSELFAEIKDFRSLDPDFRSRGQIRLLEIGVGPGSNFKYYPENARIIAVDPNPHFKTFMDANVNKFPHVTLEQFVIGVGENLSQVKDGSVDIVVTTCVLCSVDDVNAVLKEIKRVLAPGGKYFFLEHVLAEKGTKRHILQKLASPVWFFLFERCNLDREIGQMIDQFGFTKVDMKYFIVPIMFLFRMFVGPHVIGVAEN